jgi:phage gp36-like protein
MPYATADDVKVYIDAVTLQQLTDDVGAGVIDTAKMNSVIADQAARIDAALRARFVVPVAIPGAMLRSLCARLCVAPLYSRRPMVTPPVALEAVTAGAEDDLKAIAAGKVNPPEAVPLTTGADPDAPGGLVVSSEADEGWTGDLF